MGIIREENLLSLLEGPVEDGAHGNTADSGSASLIQTIDVLVGLLELGDQFFGGGTHQAARLARNVAEEMRCDTMTLEEVVLATLLRDIGRAGLEPEVRQSQGGFEPAEMDRRLKLLFLTRRGGPPFRQNVGKALLIACKAAGVPYVNPHGLRHVHAMLCLMATGDMHATQRRLGHADVGTTMRLYAYSLREDGTVAAAIDGLMAED